MINLQSDIRFTPDDTLIFDLISTHVVSSEILNELYQSFHMYKQTHFEGHSLSVREQVQKIICFIPDHSSTTPTMSESKRITPTEFDDRYSLLKDQLSEEIVALIDKTPANYLKELNCETNRCSNYGGYAMLREIQYSDDPQPDHHNFWFLTLEDDVEILEITELSLEELHRLHQIIYQRYQKSL